MALPLVPIAVTALRLGALAGSVFYLARNVKVSRTSQAAEDCLDEVEEGLAAHRCTDRPQVNCSGRWKRTIRVNGMKSGIEVDASFLGRLKVRRVE